ncbi:MAG: alpha-L-fucosidase C-terminal domain-containing protein, partial [Promethearchaeota archaeon]
PWKRAEGITTEDIPIRFTQKEEIIYAILMGKSINDKIIINDLNLENISKVYLLGIEEQLEWEQVNTDLVILLSDQVINSIAISFKIVLN